MTTPLLEMNNMSVELPIGLKVADIVSDITLTLNRGERLGVVGESGSGKSITALAAMGLCQIACVCVEHCALTAKTLRPCGSRIV